MPSITPGQDFASLAAFKTALQAWAIEDRFQPKILDSDSKRVRVGCRSGPDCPFRIRCNFSDKSGTAKVTTLDGEHCNHIPQGRSQPVRIARPEAGKMKFLVQAVPNLMEITSETSTKDIIDAVARAYGPDIMLRQAQKVKAYLLRKQKHNKCRHCGQAGHTKRNCSQRQSQHQSGSGPSSETVDASMQSDADGEELPSSDTDEPVPRTQEQHCRICHQVGHNRRNCRQQEFRPTAISASAPAPAPAPPPRPVPIPAPAPSSNKRTRNRTLLGSLPEPITVRTMLEGAQYSYTAPPDISDHQIFHSPDVGVMPPSTSSRPPPTVHTNVFAAQEAARLMQEAARLTQEAARLNHQAANLMASVLG